jgi:hypothetical protein
MDLVDSMEHIDRLGHIPEHGYHRQQVQHHPPPTGTEPACDEIAQGRHRANAGHEPQCGMRHGARQTDVGDEIAQHCAVIDVLQPRMSARYPGLTGDHELVSRGVLAARRCA